jgi:hypothetical protein
VAAATSTLTGVIGSADSQVTDEPLQRTGGDGDTDMDILVPSLLFRAGETINGQILLTPHADMSDGELGICWGYRCLSHPLVRTPALGGTSKSGQTIKLGHLNYAREMAEASAICSGVGRTPV